MRLRLTCLTCKALTPDFEIETSKPFPQKIKCKNGHEISLSWSESFRKELIWDECPACQGFDVFVQKDVHRNLLLGILMVILFLTLMLLAYDFLMGMGVLLSLTVLDIILYKTLPNVILCYRCNSEGRDYSTIQKPKAFDHHVAEQNRG